MVSVSVSDVVVDSAGGDADVAIAVDVDGAFVAQATLCLPRGLLPPGSADVSVLVVDDGGRSSAASSTLPPPAVAVVQTPLARRTSGDAEAVVVGVALLGVADAIAMVAVDGDGVVLASIDVNIEDALARGAIGLAATDAIAVIGDDGFVLQQRLPAGVSQVAMTPRLGEGDEAAVGIAVLVDVVDVEVGGVVGAACQAPMVLGVPLCAAGLGCSDVLRCAALPSMRTEGTIRNEGLSLLLVVDAAAPAFDDSVAVRVVGVVDDSGEPLEAAQLPSAGLSLSGLLAAPLLDAGGVSSAAARTSDDGSEVLLQVAIADVSAAGAVVVQLSGAAFGALTLVPIVDDDDAGVGDACDLSFAPDGAFFRCGFGLRCVESGAAGVCEAAPPPLSCAPGASLVQLSASDLPRAIPDVGSVDSVIDLSAFAGATVEDIVVVIDAIDHGFVPDLAVDIVVDDTASAIAAFGRGGSDIRGLVLSDDCTTPLSEGRPPYTGCFRPLSSFGALRGELAPAALTLRITDDVAADSGELRAWRLGLCVRP